MTIRKHFIPYSTLILMIGPSSIYKFYFNVAKVALFFIENSLLKISANFQKIKKQTLTLAFVLTTCI